MNWGCNVIGPSGLFTLRLEGQLSHLTLLPTASTIEFELYPDKDVTGERQSSSKEHSFQGGIQLGLFLENSVLKGERYDQYTTVSTVIP